MATCEGIWRYRLHGSQTLQVCGAVICTTLRHTGFQSNSYLLAGKVKCWVWPECEGNG